MFLKFDAFVFRADADVLEVLQHFENLSFSLSRSTAKFGYQNCYELELGGQKHGIIQYGGDSVGTGVYVQVMGSQSGRVRDSVLSTDWDCHLLRADVALDFDGAKYFTDLSTDLTELAKTSNLKTSTVGDWVRGIDGRTLYIGSRSSVFMVRLYEKYKQPGIDTNGEEIIRLELEIKPARHARAESFRLSAHDLVSSSRVYSPIFEKYIKLSDGITMGSIRKESDHERALGHMIKQYQNTIKKQLEIDGGCIHTFFQTLTKHENWKND